MNTIAQQDFTKNLFALLEETFEGPPANEPSAYLDKAGGLLQTLETISAKAASTLTRSGAQTIAAHTEHLRFYVEVHQKLLAGSTERINWDESWRVQEVTPEQWHKLREDLKRTYSSAVEYLRHRKHWGEDEIGLSLSIVAHTAYHLGAIRQLTKTLSDTSGESYPAV